MDPKQKRAVAALRTVTAMDRRRHYGTLDEAAERAALEAEACLRVLGGAAFLEAFRAWRDGTVQAHDPTGGPVRIVEDRAAPGGRYSDMQLRARP